jgi:phage terminase large subunit-like protein
MRLLPNQWQFIQDVYGEKEPRIAVFSEPRGNGKTGLLAGLMLCHLFGPECEARGACYSAAINRQQAAIIFEECCAIIEQVEEFAVRANMRRWHKIIEVTDGPGKGSVYEALSADARRGHGLAPSFWCYDELAQTKDRRLLDNLTTAMGKRHRSLGIIISTQAEDDEHALSQVIDDGLTGVDPKVLVHLTAAPKDADPFDEAVIRSVNPAFGKFLDEEVVFSEATRAKRMPSFESAFRNLRLNQRVPALERDPFVTPEVWARGDAEIDESLFTDLNRQVFGGIDLSARLDLTAAVFAVQDDDGVVHLMPRAWTPAATVNERTLRDRAPYDAWVRGGLIEAVPGEAIDYAWVAAELAHLAGAMPLTRVAYDRWRMEFLRKELAEIGVILPLVEMGQGFKDISPAIEAFEELAATNRIRHGGHPVLRWCISNCVIARDTANGRKLDKVRSFGRIDLAQAAVMAIGTMKASTEPVIDVSAIVAGGFAWRYAGN